MGKKRVAKKSGSGLDSGLKSRALSKTPKKRMENGIVHIQSTYNNTRVVLTDTKGNVMAGSSSGALGFKGAKKGTPYAAAKVGEVIAEQADLMGVKELEAIVKGIGAGRDSALRAISGKGIQFSSIKDTTPVPFNGPRPRKARRV